MTLSVPIPVFTAGGPPATRFGSEKPVEVSCGPVMFADGTLLTEKNATQFEFLLYRRSINVTLDVWDEASKAWVAESVRPKPQLLWPDGGQWKTLLIGVGQPSKFATDVSTGFPQYFVKCFFGGRNNDRAQLSVASVSSSAVQIIDTSDRYGGLVLSPTFPDLLTEVGMYLRASPQTAAVSVSVLQTSSGFMIELKGNGASLRLTESGAILLSPAIGQLVHVDGSLSVSAGITVAGTTLSVP